MLSSNSQAVEFITKWKTSGDKVLAVVISANNPWLVFEGVLVEINAESFRATRNGLESGVNFKLALSINLRSAKEAWFDVRSNGEPHESFFRFRADEYGCWLFGFKKRS